MFGVRMVEVRVIVILGFRLWGRYERVQHKLKLPPLFWIDLRDV